jgi:hypothetical protein
MSAAATAIESEPPTKNELVASEATETGAATTEAPVPDLQSSDSTPVTPAANSGPRWIAESVAVSAEEASTSLEQEMLRAQANVAEPEQAPAQSESAPASPMPLENAPAAISDEKNGATFAAAASAVSSTVASSAVSESDPEPGIASETAAAWQNWQHIRESVMSAQSTEAIAHSVAEVAQASAPGPAAESAEAATNPTLEGAALASIVDSVLAELKPKLMEEIAKKLKK